MDLTVPEIEVNIESGDLIEAALEVASVCCDSCGGTLDTSVNRSDIYIERCQCEDDTFKEEGEEKGYDEGLRVGQEGQQIILEEL